MFGDSDFKSMLFAQNMLLAFNKFNMKGKLSFLIIQKHINFQKSHNQCNGE